MSGSAVERLAQQLADIREHTANVKAQSQRIRESLITKQVLLDRLKDHLPPQLLTTISQQTPEPMNEDSVQPHIQIEQDADFDFHEDDVDLRTEAHIHASPSIQSSDYTDRIDRHQLKQVPKSLKTHLKTYQVTGAEFLFNSLCGRELRINTENPVKSWGCVCADPMGMGKTLQVLTALYMLLRLDILPVPKILIIAPAPVMPHWVLEAEKVNSWLNRTDVQLPVPILLDGRIDRGDRDIIINEWKRLGGALVASYSMILEILENSLFQEKFLEFADVLILDEGHKIRNADSQTSFALNSFKTVRRIVVTGYPLQNNLMEMYSIVHFAAPNGCRHILGDTQSFCANFVEPIISGQSSTNSDSRLRSHRRALVLFHLLTTSGILIRRNDSVLRKDLPPKYDLCIRIRLSAFQRKLYIAALSFLRQLDRGIGPFEAFNLLSMICVHPAVLKHTAVDHEHTSYSAWVGEEFQRSSEEVDVYAIEHSGKMLAMMTIIRQSQRVNESVVIFSRWIKSLDYIQSVLESYNMKYTSHKIKFARFDGKSGPEMRKEIAQGKILEDVDVLLVTTLCGEGISLVQASRVIVMDVNWNPNHDLQASLRVYRYGQVRPVFVYRFIADGTLESKVFLRQLRKIELSKWVVDASSLGITLNEDLGWRDCVRDPPKFVEIGPEASLFIFPGIGDDFVTRNLITSHASGMSLHESWISAIEELQWLFTDIERNVEGQELEDAIGELQVDLVTYDAQTSPDEPEETIEESFL